MKSIQTQNKSGGKSMKSIQTNQKPLETHIMVLNTIWKRKWE